MIALETRKRTSNRRGHWRTIVLVAALACALLGGAQAAPSTGAVIVPDRAAPKPVVTIQGNVVVEKGKPTGFYELALCVRTARTVKEIATGDVVPDQLYVDALTAAAEGNAAALDTFFQTYEVTHYPFQSAAATVHIDLDALTAVTWGAGKPVYESWTAAGATGTSGSYGKYDTGYPRGLDLTGVVEQPDIFTDLTKIVDGTAASVRLDTANPDEMTNATALVEDYDAADHTALLTLSASTTTTANVVYDVDTPVVVVRFAYDLNRFQKTDVMTQPNQSNFWMGLDKNDPSTTGPNATGQTALTFLAEGDQAGGDLYGASDAQAAAASIHQTVWYSQNMLNDQVGQQTTSFYYYLGAETPSTQGTGAYKVIDSGAVVTPDPTLNIPKTAGNAVLAKKDAAYPMDVTDPDPTENYSFFQNLLNLRAGTLRLTLVNAETYRKPTGGIGGAQILFYDWNDDLIGALVVDPEGDARAAVNEYVERVMIHNDLRTGDAIAGAADLTALQGDTDYMGRVNSLAREHTYRGDYAYTVGGNDTVGPDGDTLNQGRENGKDFPLTNKLDYAFYRRVTTQTEVSVPDPADSNKTITTRYFSTAPVSEGPVAGDPDYDGYLYPYVYGWAIVEDGAQDLDKDNWILHKDSVKTESTWTTFGSGELSDIDPTSAVQGTVTDPANGGTVPYNYAVTEGDPAWYLKFADFSAMEKMLREGQDVLIVKAVYEPGESLLEDYNYTVVDGSLHIERYSIAASTEASVYSFQYQYRRASQANGPWQGVNRTREPAVQTGYTYDVNAFDSEDKDLDPSVDTNVFFLKTLANNDDILNIDMTAGGVLWKLDYQLVDTYGENISTGVQRSAGEELDLKNNFLYSEGIEYSDRQGTEGFVLEATLNTLLTEANKAARGEANKLSRHMSLTTLTDMNWRANADGTEFTWSNYTRATTYLQDLVTRLYNAKVSIDPKTGDVKLGWHQIQRHILMCMQANGTVDGIFSGGVLMSEEACAGFSWCRLDDCGLTITVDISNLGDIFVAMDKAKDETGDKHPAKDALDKLLADTPSLLDTFWFRQDEDGRKFQNRTELYRALEDVYTKLAGAGLDQDAMKAVTADQVQEIIINKTYPTTGKTYWWKEGGKRPVSTWKDFVEAGMLVATGDVPDALDAMTKANLPDAVRDMISYGAPTGSPDNVGWFRCRNSNEDDNAFTDVEAFKTQWVQTLTVLKDHYDLPKNWNTIPWAEIQYALITGTYKPAAQVLTETNYWWRDGGLPKLTFDKLVAAINQYKAGDATELDRLLAKGVNPVNNEVYLRRTAAGSGFTSADQFKALLDNSFSLIGFASNAGDYLDYAAPGTPLKNMTPHQLQYILLNSSALLGGAIPSEQDVKDNYNYWWIEDPHVPTDAQNINDIMDLFMYTYWKRDGVGSGPLGFALDKLDTATMEKLKLRAEVHGMRYDTETNADLVTAVLGAINRMPYKIDTFSNQSAADLTKELQYLLLHPAASYTPAGSITENYWWQSGGFTANTHETMAQAAWLASVGFDSKTAPDAMDQITDLDFITRRSTMAAQGMAMRADGEGTAFSNLTAFKNALTGAIQSAEGVGMTYNNLTGLTNYQLQYLLLNGVYKSDADVKAEVIVDGKDAYWWFTSDTPPEGGDDKKEEIPIDEDEWSSFITSAAAYFKKSSGDPSKFVYDLTDDKVANVLRLHKASGEPVTAAELFAGDKSDYTWQVLDAIFKSKRKSTFFNTMTRAMKQQPTWYEFQYVLIHLDEIKLSKEMPDTQTCENEKEKWEWKWTTAATTQWVQHTPDEATWNDYMTSAAGYFKKSSGDAAKFVFDLTDVENTLYLGVGSNALTANEVFVGDKSDYTWQVLDAIFKSKRKSTFFNTMTRAMKQQPTWYEFQYVLSHLDEIKLSKEMPDAQTCEEWVKSRDPVVNVPWSWREETTRARLLEEEPDWIEEDVTPPRASPPWLDIVPETPLGEETLAHTQSDQGGKVA